MVSYLKTGDEMKKTVFAIAVLALGLAFASEVDAACYADYKAKKSSPLQLHYGVVKLPDRICSNRPAIRRKIGQKIGVDGWNLLNVISVFGPDGLAKRRGNAGTYFLKY